ncbi:hypothetical protein RB7273 [Rhodopirellula baltica SH 1]|uniref:Uncharacterized protein n=1 Tax=Rhodopirellula baltica (strain DSM 10527 / NCIMB 13988 / SH1) TaxID=243090 RepID=Q7UNY6_RHOBA|nr:hypothetical protein RB7273 [Rhodopirellula baltica SH 1]
MPLLPRPEAKSRAVHSGGETAAGQRTVPMLWRRNRLRLVPPVPSTFIRFHRPECRIVACPGTIPKRPQGIPAKTSRGRLNVPNHTFGKTRTTDTGIQSPQRTFVADGTRTVRQRVAF